MKLLLLSKTTGSFSIKWPTSWKTKLWFWLLFYYVLDRNLWVYHIKLIFSGFLKKYLSSIQYISTIFTNLKHTKMSTTKSLFHLPTGINNPNARVLPVNQWQEFSDLSWDRDKLYNVMELIYPTSLKLRIRFKTWNIISFWTWINHDS